jgi:hypothetical protein
MKSEVPLTLETAAALSLESFWGRPITQSKIKKMFRSQFHSSLLWSQPDSEMKLKVPLILETTVALSLESFWQRPITQSKIKKDVYVFNL